MARSVNNVRTVSDTKRAFHAAHTRPINSLYRRVVEELMVEMHLLAVGSGFSYSPIYALGVVTTFDRAMTGYEPESDRDSIFAAICHSASQIDGSQFRSDASALLEGAKSLSLGSLMAAFQGEGDGSAQVVKDAIAPLLDGDTPTKYTRLLGIGLFTLLETCDSDLAGDKDKLAEQLGGICDALKLPTDKLTKDLELYRSNLEKLAMAQETMKDVLEAERKKREQRAQAKEEAKTKAETKAEAAAGEETVAAGNGTGAESDS
ncbi:MAG: photosystem II biogenesis protein Psp29 [Cyanobacteria bacterium P01_H01_bin.130]